MLACARGAWAHAAQAATTDARHGNTRDRARRRGRPRGCGVARGRRDAALASPSRRRRRLHPRPRPSLAALCTSAPRSAHGPRGATPTACHPRRPGHRARSQWPSWVSASSSNSFGSSSEGARSSRCGGGRLFAAQCAAPSPPRRPNSVSRAVAASTAPSPIFRVPERAPVQLEGSRTHRECRQFSSYLPTASLRRTAGNLAPTTLRECRREGTSIHPPGHLPAAYRRSPPAALGPAAPSGPLQQPIRPRRAIRPPRLRGASSYPARCGARWRARTHVTAHAHARTRGGAGLPICLHRDSRASVRRPPLPAGPVAVLGVRVAATAAVCCCPGRTAPGTVCIQCAGETTKLYSLQCLTCKI